MKRIRFVTLHRRNIAHIVVSLLLTLSIVYINIFFFSILNPSITTFFSSQGLDSSAQGGTEHSGGKLAIIIDDFGQDRSGVKEMMSIDRHLTLAIMPFLTFSQSDAKSAHDKGYEVIIHLPMEPEVGKASWLGPRPIVTSLNDLDIQQLVLDSFESVPYAVGANIHMGSKASSDERIMSDILEIIKAKRLYFVDSRTSRHPISKKLADEMGVLCYENNIFLDSTQSLATIKKQLSKAGELALKRGKAVAIGHVGKEGGKVTAQAISEMLPEFDKQKIELVFVSELGK